MDNENKLFIPGTKKHNLLEGVDTNGMTKQQKKKLKRKMRKEKRKEEKDESSEEDVKEDSGS
jgi:hypothetical protein